MNAGWSKTGRWLVGAAWAVLASLACAQPSFGPGGHFGGGHFGFGADHAGGAHFGGIMGGGMHIGSPMGRPAAAPQAARAANRHFASAKPADRGLQPSHAARALAAGGYPSAPPMRGGWDGDGLATPRFAGGITPVSTEARNVPRPPSDAPMVRAGSIREDVARYNEERSSRPVPRPPDEMSRPPAPSPYRN